MQLIATAGFYTTKEKLNKMILTGADVLRYNFSRRSIDENIEFLKLAQDTIAELNADTKIMVDMPINKIRIGDFNIKVFAVREGEDFICRSASYSNDCNEFIPIHTTKLGEQVRLNQIITIGDGEVALQVIEIIDSETIKIKVFNNGTLHYMRTFNIDHRKNCDELIENYKNILSRIENIDIDYLAISHLDDESNEKIRKLPYFTFKTIKPPKIIVKIDSSENVRQAEIIMKDSFYNMIMLDRGELGVNLPYEQCGAIQKQITTMSKLYKKPILISSQILESTINNFVPLRSEVLDITNMVLDGIDGMVFCKETGFNTRPAYTLSVAKRIVEAAKKYKNQEKTN